MVIIRHRLIFLMVIFFVLQFLLIHRARAEYRVYKLGIKYSETQKEETEVLSTLDNIQYLSYYMTAPGERVRIIQHWMCRGRTDDFARYCPAPVKRVAASVQGQSPNPTVNP